VKFIKKNYLFLILYLTFILFVYHFSFLVNIESINSEELYLFELNLETSNNYARPPFIIGTSPLRSIDPQNSWSSNELDVIGQVCEGLFAYNLSKPSFSIIPNLAAADGIWSPDYLNYTVTIKSNINFHDGTPLNASAVKWCFDRLEYLGGIESAVAYGLYQYYDLSLDQFFPIINRTEVINNLTIRFILNQQYPPFQTLLSFPASFVVSPTSTPFYESINITTGDLVGTGPFVFDGIENATFVHLHTFDDYRNGRANIDTIIYHVFQNDAHRNNALLNGTIHFLDSPLPSKLEDFEADVNLNILRMPSMSAQYLFMNNKQINMTLRKAISYAINYTYIIEQIHNNEVHRLKSPLPESMYLANYSLDVPTYNITKAREIMQNMGFGKGWDTNFPGSHENLWQSATFASYNFTYNNGNTIREALCTLLQNNLNDIGIDIIRANMSIEEYLNRVYNSNGKDRNMLQLLQIGWAADLNDPANFINTIFTNRTPVFNVEQYNGYESAIETGRNPFDLNDNVQLLMDAASIESNPNIRKSYYDRIQQLLVEEDTPCAYLYCPNLIDIYHIDLSGYIQTMYFSNPYYLCTWNRFYSDCDINHPSDITYEYSTIGHQISWTLADLYYENQSYAIYKDGFELTNKTWTSGDEITINIDGLTINTYNYTIVAIDGYGGKIQDQVDISVLNYASTCSSPPSDFSYTVGSENNEISWIIYDLSVSNPTYTIYRDGDLIQPSTTWTSGVAITINVDGLSTGTYDYSITAIDGLGESYQDTVTITVTLSPPPTFPPELIIVIGLIIGIIGIISIISYVRIKKKKTLKPKRIEEPKRKQKVKAKELIKMEEKASAAARAFEKSVKQVNNLNEEAITAKEAGEFEKAIKLYERTIDPLNHAKKQAYVFNPNLVPMIDDQIENVDLNIHNLEVEIIFSKGNTSISKSNEFIKEQKYNDAIELLRDSLNQFQKAKDLALNYNLLEKVKMIEAKESEINQTIDKYKKQLYSLLLPMETEKTELVEKEMLATEGIEKQIPIPKFRLEDIKILRGGDWSVEANLSIFNYKVKITNQSEFIISNIQVIITSIPPGLELKSNKVYTISDLSQGSYISPTFKFAATQSCVGNKLESLISFKDYKGNIRTIIIDPFEISYVCNLLVPKIISNQQYEQKTAFMQERKFEMECDMNPLELERTLVPILKNSNFYLLEKTPEPHDSKYRNIRGFAEGKYDKDNVGLFIAMQKIAEQNTKLIIKTMSDREEKLIDLLKDINNKCIELKSINELILEYSKEIENAISQIENLEEYLISHLGSDWERIRHIWDKYKNGEIDRKELIWEGAKLIGKKFLSIFIQTRI
jgi:ABC-type transport system substrate-binding protein